MQPNWATRYSCSRVENAESLLAVTNRQAVILSAIQVMTKLQSIVRVWCLRFRLPDCQPLVSVCNNTSPVLVALRYNNFKRNQTQEQTSDAQSEIAALVKSRQAGGLWLARHGCRGFAAVRTADSLAETTCR